MSEELEPRILTADEQAVAVRSLTEAVFACRTLLDQLKATPEVPDVARNALAVAEYRLADAGKALGIQTDGATQIVERSAIVRAAHERVAELERQLGQVVSVGQTATHMKHLSQVLRDWWAREGFGAISDFRFTDDGCVEARLSCTLFGAFALMESETPISDKVNKTKWLQSLRDRGYDLVDSRGGEDMSLVDSQPTRVTLFALLRRNLPSVRIWETSNHFDSHGVMVLRNVRVFIRDLADIAALEPVVKS